MAKEAQSNNGHLDFQQEPLKAIAKEMGGAERVLQGILETSESIIFIKDLDGRYVLVNPAFSRLFHRGLEETLGHTDADLFPQKVAQRLRAADARVLKSREILSSIDRLTIEHEERIFVATKAPLQDNEGNVIGVSGFATEITGEVRARDQLAHLNKILRAIRNVNQLIVTEKDRERLLQGACERLVKNGSYHNAWIALLDDSGQLVTAAESGFGGDFAPMLEQLRQRIIPQCGKDALANPGVIAMFHPQRDCSGCPLAASCAGRVKSAVCLAYSGKVFGFLVLSLQSKYAQDPKERALISEIAGDLGFALHDLEIEEERQQSEERYRLIVENSHSGIIIVDERYRFQWVNDMFCEMLARDKAEIVGRDFRDFLDDESRQLVADRYVRRQRGEDTPSRYEFNVVRKDGTKKRVEIRSAVVRDRAGRMRTIAQLLDITDRVRTQDALREENRMTLALSRSAGAVVSSLNMREALDHILDELQHVVQADAGSVMLVEGDTARIVGARAYSDSAREYDVLGTTFIISQTPNLLHMIETGAPLIVADTHTSPEWVQLANLEWLRSYAGVPIRAHDKTLGFLNVDRATTGPFDDKTIERLQVFATIAGAAIENATLIEEANRRADRLETAQRVAHMGFLDWDLKTDKILLSDEFCRLNGLKKGEDITALELLAQVVHEDDLEYARKNLNLAISGKKELDIDHRIVRPDGKVLWVHSQGHLIHDEKGNPKALLGTVVDITSRKEAEAKLRKSLSDIMRVLSATIEIRDPYTAGHQVRVAKLAVAIATEMKLPEDRVEGVGFAAQVHDIGKVAIPAEILAKPTALNEIEFSLIKEHPEVAYDVLRDIDFPWPIADIVLQHHERIDGSGYPNGLKNEDILLEARILGVADVVEAMSSHRPYRASLGLDAALDEIKKNKGVKYDKEAVEACLAVFESGFTFDQQ